jgi:hypothetical protein
MIFFEKITKKTASGPGMPGEIFQGLGKYQFTITHPVFGPHPTRGYRGLWLRLNRKILNVALLRLRFCAAKQMPLGCSIVAAKSNPNPGAIQVY